MNSVCSKLCYNRMGSFRIFFGVNFFFNRMNMVIARRTGDWVGYLYS